MIQPKISHPVVCFGEVLWDILPSGALPGGAPLNVAFHLKKLGLNPALISKVGVDDFGKDLIQMLSDCGVPTEYVDVDYDNPTGLVNANLNNQQEVTYDIAYPSAWDFIAWKEEYAKLVRDAAFFVYGSLTSRNDKSRETLQHLLEVAKTKVLDINLRPPHFHRKQVELLLGKADVLKMNIAELELITGWFSRFRNAEDRIRVVQDRFRIDTIIVTMGGDGAMVSRSGKIYRHAGFKVVIADTIGSGDAFLSGFLYQCLKDATTEDTLLFASALGAFIATQQGACPDYNISQITEMIKSNSDQPTIA